MSGKTKKAVKNFKKCKKNSVKFSTTSFTVLLCWFVSFLTLHFLAAIYGGVFEELVKCFRKSSEIYPCEFEKWLAYCGIFMVAVILSNEICEFFYVARGFADEDEWEFCDEGLKDECSKDKDSDDKDFEDAVSFGYEIVENVEDS